MGSRVMGWELGFNGLGVLGFKGLNGLGVNELGVGVKGLEV